MKSSTGPSFVRYLIRILSRLMKMAWRQIFFQVIAIFKKLSINPFLSTASNSTLTAVNQKTPTKTTQIQTPPKRVTPQAMTPSFPSTRTSKSTTPFQRRKRRRSASRGRALWGRRRGRRSREQWRGSRYCLGIGGRMRMISLLNPVASGKRAKTTKDKEISI